MLISQIASARRSHSSSVRIGVRNQSSLLLGAGAMWVKGGEAVNRPADISPGEEEEVLQAALMVKEGMEQALDLSVPTPVRIKVGTSWGELQDFRLEEHLTRQGQERK